MGLFDFLKKKDRNSELVKIEKTSAPDNNKSLAVKGLTIHEDLRNLVWIGDGKFKNFSQNKNNENCMEVNGFRISISFMNQEEPSLIYTNQKVSQPTDTSKVDRPPYFPTYSALTPEQKW